MATMTARPLGDSLSPTETPESEMGGLEGSREEGIKTE